jgi:hypothetical protein
VYEKVLKWQPFIDWQAAVNAVPNKDTEKPDLRITELQIQGVDFFGPRIGFLKFKVSTTHI